ncbi:MAG: stage II sporulation protein P [Clostridia bacterium]|nr:stage II sporulation protein P [Clostridia bacterium]
MNTGFARFLRKKDDFVKVYRVGICVFSAAAICLCGLYKAGNFFTASNLRSITLGESAGFQLIAAKEKNYVVDNKSLYNDEVYLVEEEKNESETESRPVKKGAYPILSLDMSGGAQKGEILINDTDSGVEVDAEALVSAPFPKSLDGEAVTALATMQKPLVLIIHTHATECYSIQGADSYDNETSFRTENKEENIVSVGKVLCDTLNSRGVSTIHCDILHDAKDYNSSYNNSLESVKYYLNKYPSIKYVFDIHRDAIIRDNGELIKTECTVDSHTVAQIMILVGTNSGGADHPLWTDNLNVALKLQKNLTSSYPCLARPVNLRAASFNQQYAPGSLLFEIGSCGNTLSEAKLAAVYLGEALAEVIKET